MKIEILVSKENSYFSDYCSEILGLFSSGAISLKFWNQTLRMMGLHSSFIKVENNTWKNLNMHF